MTALMVGLVLRYAPLYRDLLQGAGPRGQLGESSRSRRRNTSIPYHGAFFMRDWRRYEKWSGSFMLEKCCHDLDLYNGLIGCAPASRGELRRPQDLRAGERSPQVSAPTISSLYHRKPSGWNGSNKVFDTDGDIIDYPDRHRRI
jgi:predicted dehydrogenase